MTAFQLITNFPKLLSNYLVIFNLLFHYFRVVLDKLLIYYAYPGL